ncbi:MAG: hypothetical protein JWR17_3633 [Pseudomonas sp.]|nr:hypothetical protein [Pseudomonas sp.]
MSRWTTDRTKRYPKLFCKATQYNSPKGNVYYRRNGVLDEYSGHSSPKRLKYHLKTWHS